MDWLEEELKRALARQEPAPDFAARGAARRNAAGVPARRWLAVAASVVVLAGGGMGYRWHQGVQAKEQVMAALRLAGGKLSRVQSQVREVGQ
jgi:hypothetical protein